MHERRHKVQPLEIPGCSYGDLSSFVLSSLSLKGKAVCMHTRPSRASKEEIHLISSQRQASTIKTLGPKVSQSVLQTWEKKLLLPQRTTEISCRHTGCNLGMDWMGQENSHTYGLCPLLFRIDYLQRKPMLSKFEFHFNLLILILAPLGNWEAIKAAIFSFVILLLFKLTPSQAWWVMPITPALRMLKQENWFNFNVRPGWAA